MPICHVPGCLFHTLDLRVGHKCIKCKKEVHTLCAHHLADQPADSNLVCFACFPQGSTITPAIISQLLQGGIERPSHQQEQTTTKKKNLTPTIEKKRKEPPAGAVRNKTKQTAALKKAALNKEDRRIKKTSSQQKSFTLKTNTAQEDPLVMNSVWFDIESEYGQQLSLYFGAEKLHKYLFQDGAKRFLKGTVARKSKQKGGRRFYDVQWESHDLGETSCELDPILTAIETAKEGKKRVERQKRVERENKQTKGRLSSPCGKYHPKQLFSKDVLHCLSIVDEGEEGIPNSSDSEAEYDEVVERVSEEVLEEDEVDEKYEHHYQCKELFTDTFLDDGRVVAEENESERNDLGFEWSTAGSTQQPIGLSNRISTHVQPNMTGLFKSPLSSFIAFCPLKVWKSIVYFTNKKAKKILLENKTRRISGIVWEDVTLNEIMTYIGILIWMTLRPAPGLTFTECWKDIGWHPYTAKMGSKRFQQIRATLHFNDDEKMSESNDALFKVRPFLNCLKLTFGAYLNIGNELALDEASIASRSSYGRDLIFFNPTKPGGKYHFRLYFLCDTDSYNCIRFRFHTRNTSDVGDGLYEGGDDSNSAIATNTYAGPKTTGLDDEGDHDEEVDGTTRRRTTNDGEPITDEDPSKMVTLVLDMAKPIFNSGRIINMDNYYTSPAVAVELLKKQVYIRGTCRSSRKGFPKGVCFTNTEAGKRGRGAIKKMVDVKHGISCYGWVDGNPVHFLTTADGSEVVTVQRRVNSERRQVTAPIGIKRYNNGMQAVDRHDQLRKLFSIADRHGFKKYYMKIFLGLLDMALVNAWLHFKMVNPLVAKKRHARRDFMEELANALLKEDWEYYQGVEVQDEHRLLTGLVKNGNNKHFNIDSNHDDENEKASGAVCDADDEVQIVAKKKCSPIAVHHLMEKRSQRMGFGCQVCTFEGRGRGNTRNVVVCPTHRLRLCTVSHPVKKLLQEKGPLEGKEPIDYSWRAPNTDWTCWEKAHKYYIPQGLFRNNVPTLDGSNISFQCCKISSTLYNSKRRALGEEVIKRGGTSGGPGKMKETKKPNKRIPGKKKKESNNIVRNNSNGEDDDSESESERDIPQAATMVGEVDEDDGPVSTDDDDYFYSKQIEGV
jgi:hypothetical protein